MCLPVLSRNLSWIFSTSGWQSLGNNLSVSSVDLFEPNNPYVSLYPLPSTLVVRISSNPNTTLAPACFKILFVLALV